jgi:hypothetical protein
LTLHPGRRDSVADGARARRAIRRKCPNRSRATCV